VKLLILFLEMFYLSNFACTAVFFLVLLRWWSQ